MAKCFAALLVQSKRSIIQFMIFRLIVRFPRINKLLTLPYRLCVLRDTRGQDLIEYALMAGFVAIAAGAVMPSVSSSISKIFSKVSSVMAAAASQS
jgi:pilus assembly protein Flp/PilA